jgi:ribosomal protein S18 acetylase RimI-like enzyme
MKFEALQPKWHDRVGFDCGDVTLNRYLQQFANQDQTRGLCRVYVLAEQQRILGYYSISAYSVAGDTLGDQTRVSAYAELPFLLLDQLAVDKNVQGRGYGDALIIHAFKTTVDAADKIGIFGMIVDAKHEQAVAFYQRFGFKPLIGNKNRLVLPYTAIKKALQAEFDS